MTPFHGYRISTQLPPRGTNGPTRYSVERPDRSSLGTFRSRWGHYGWEQSILRDIESRGDPDVPEDR